MPAFLTLAPIQSTTYPSQVRSPVSETARVSATPVEEAAVADTVVSAPTERHRSDSTSSTSSARGFLKLSPVHYGGEPGVGDYSEE